MHRSSSLETVLFICSIFATLCGTADSVLGSSPAADTTIGLGGLQPNPEYPALVSLKGQEDYNKIMSFLVLKKGMPKSIAAFIIKESNLSPPLD